MQHLNHKATNKWVVTSGSQPEAAVRLFCFSYAGAGGAAYRGWGDAAPGHVEVCTIQLPGRENRLREPAFTSLAELVGVLTPVIQAASDRPFAFYGHSLGAIIAFETVRQLRRVGGVLPAALFVSASRAPQLPWPHPPVRQLEDLELLTEVHRRYGSVPGIILEDEELRQLLTPTLRADMSLIETYQYEPEVPFELPIVAFGGDTDRMVGRPDIEQWSKQTSESFKLRMLDGDHLFLQSRRQELLEDIGGALGLASSHVLTPTTAR